MGKIHSKATKVQQYLLPGLIFQSLVISGGYGTGAELSQFFFPYGAKGGILAICLVTFGVWALVCSVSFVFAHKFKAYNYKDFFQRLLGRWWILYELCYFAMLLMVLAVLTATAGISFNHLFGAPLWVGKVIVCLATAALVLGGTKAVEGFLSAWSYVLYAVYIVFLIACFANFGKNIEYNLVSAPVVEPHWPLGGAKYAFYNLGIIPAVLFSLRHAKSGKGAAAAGVIAAAVAVIPAILLLVAMTGLYPQIIGAEAPVNMVFQALNMPFLHFLFQIVLFGTLIETGSGMIKAVSDRFESSRSKGEAESIRKAVTAVCLVLGFALSSFGLTALIDKGYGTLSWCFLAVFVVPVLTVGVKKILAKKKA